MTDSESSPRANTNNDVEPAHRGVSATLLLSLFSLLSFVIGLFIAVSPALFAGGVCGLGHNYDNMDPQARGFTMLIDGGYSIGLGAIITIGSSIFGMMVGLSAGLKSLFKSK